MAAKKYFRPYLTLEQIEYLIKVLQSAPTSPIQYAVLTNLQTLHYKAAVGVTNSAYETTPRQTMLDRLTAQPAQPGKFADTRKALYQLWIDSPISLTPEQVQQVDEYRYAEDLMSEEEIAEFEKSLGL